MLESESQYKILTNSLPIIIFSMNLQGEIVYANEWFTNFIGVTVQELNNNKWKSVIHEADYGEFSIVFDENIVSDGSVIKTQCRLKKAATGEYLWHLLSLSPINDERENLLYWIGFLVDINAQKLVEKTLQDNRNLEAAQI